MSSVVISGNTSGTITLDAPAVSGTTTLTLPATSGTILTTANTFGAGTGPAFSAYQSSGQSISNNTQTKVEFQSEEFDTNNNFDATTDYRFTPTVAGYYQVNSSILVGATGTYFCQSTIFKNGSAFKIGALINANGSAYPSAVVNSLIYLDGSTDYIEIYIFQFSGSPVTLGSSNTNNYFQAAMVRSA